MSLIPQLQDSVSLPATSFTRLLVYFIPGNPGLVEYYHIFLKHIHSSLSSDAREVTTIYGSSHDGFEIHSDPSSQHGHGPPFSLEEVISGTKRKITARAKSLQKNLPGESRVQVILIGHSVGAYILLEVLAWWQNARESQEHPCPFTIIGGIALFPTIVHISKSDKGRQMTPVLSIPFLPSLAQGLARLLSFVPLWLWNWPRTLTPGEKRPEHAAVTEAVIRSRHGARQVIYMAGDEMTSIKEDKWHPEDLWGVLSHEAISLEESDEAPLVNVTQTVAGGTDCRPRTKLFFYWGEDDYWVDNRVRDKLIGERAKRECDVETRHWPDMVVDRHGMDHCFSLCEEHSKLVGKQVATWIEGLQGECRD